MSGSGSTSTGAGWEEERSLYREWSPLDHLVSRVPHRGRLAHQQGDRYSINIVMIMAMMMTMRIRMTMMTIRMIIMTISI